MRQTSDANDFVNVKSHARNVCSLRLLFLGYQSFIKNKRQTAVINIVNFDRIFYKFDASYASQHVIYFQK